MPFNDNNGMRIILCRSDLKKMRLIERNLKMEVGRGYDQILNAILSVDYRGFPRKIAPLPSVKHILI